MFLDKTRLLNLAALYQKREKKIGREKLMHLFLQLSIFTTFVLENL